MAANNNVTANISHKGDVYYIIINYYQDGKRKQKWIKTELSVSGNNKRKVEQKRIEVLNEWKDKLVLNDRGVLFSDYLKLWLEETKHTISENTYFGYKQTIYNTICPYFESKKIALCDLKPYHIQEFYNMKMERDGVTANTVHHYHANIHKALRHAVKTERIMSNPADKEKIELPEKQKHIADFYSADEMKRLLDYAKESSLETVIRLAAWFGLRRGEIVGLKWSSIDFSSKTLYVTGTVTDKGASGSKIENLHYVPTTKTTASLRSFPMSDFIIEYLLQVRECQEKRKQIYPNYNHKWDDFVCVRNNGDLIPLEYISRTFPELCKKAGLKRLKLHELRHSNISALLDSGASMKELQEWAGHKDYKTTANTYSHLQANSKKKMLEALEKILC